MRLAECALQARQKPEAAHGRAAVVAPGFVGIQICYALGRKPSGVREWIHAGAL